MAGTNRIPRLLTPKQVWLFFGLQLPVVYALLAAGKLGTEWKEGKEKILRESVYEWLDSLRDEEAA